ncbi:MAG: extracellular solute-binding protein [Planctomycetota bacterium]
MFPLRYIPVSVLAALVGVSLFTSCWRDAAEGEPIVLYSGRSAAIMGPLLEAFKQDTGLDVQAQWGSSTADLANLVAADGDLTPCDLFLAQDSGHLSALARAGLLAPLPRDVLDAVGEAFRDPGERWVGTSGRVRVLVHRPGFPAAQLPATLEAVAELASGLRFGWAPGNASFEAHIAGLVDAWGEERARTWLTRLATRDPEPVRFNSNSAQVAAVARGSIDVGWVNHYYLHKQRVQDPSLEAVNYSFPTRGDAGNVLIVAGIGVTAPAGPRRERALALARFLVSERAQRFFAEEVFEYPLRPGIDTAGGVPPLDDIGLSDIDIEALTRVDQAVRLLTEVGVR